MIVAMLKLVGRWIIIFLVSIISVPCNIFMWAWEEGGKLFFRFFVWVLLKTQPEKV